RSIALHRRMRWREGITVVEAFRAKVASRLQAFREWSDGRALTGCHLVNKYCGDETLHAQDIPLADADARIAGYLCEGFYVDWGEQVGKLYLVVWESDDPQPPWSDVVRAAASPSSS